MERDFDHLGLQPRPRCGERLWRDVLGPKLEETRISSNSNRGVPEETDPRVGLGEQEGSAGGARRALPSPGARGRVPCFPRHSRT